MEEHVFYFKESREPWKPNVKLESIITESSDKKKGNTASFDYNNGTATSDKNKVILGGDYQKNPYISHEDYLQYLEFTYLVEQGYIIKPDFIWFTIMCEIAQFVNSDPEKFRKYYTTRKKEEGKISINVPGGVSKISGCVELPLDLATKAVLELIPTNITEDMIVPKFSTLTERSEWAFKCSFLETVSPFYQYGLYGCGFSKIKILGTIDDYKLMITTLNKIQEIIPDFDSYFKNCIEQIEEIIKEWDNKYFWKDICWTEDGYGTKNVDGWFTKFYRNYDGRTKSVSSFPKHITKVDYTDLHDDSKFTMYIGLLTSTYEDGCYVPDFIKVITQLKSE
jgi:hypothetical protein